MTEREVSSERVSEERLGQIATDKDNFYRPEIKAMAQELLSLRSSAKTVGVKKLEWVATGGRDWVADCVLGQYQLNRDLPEAGGAFSLWKAGWNDVDDFADFETLKEAKAAAQADYERRVLSAIEAPAAPSEVTEAMVERFRAFVKEATGTELSLQIVERALTAALKGGRP